QTWPRPARFGQWLAIDAYRRLGDRVRKVQRDLISRVRGQEPQRQVPDVALHGVGDDLVLRRLQRRAFRTGEVASPAEGKRRRGFAAETLRGEKFRGHLCQWRCQQSRGLPGLAS